MKTIIWSSARRVGVIYVFKRETGAREEGSWHKRWLSSDGPARKVATFAFGKSYEGFVTRVTLASIKGRYARYNTHKSRPLLLSHARHIYSASVLKRRNVVKRRGAFDVERTFRICKMYDFQLPLTFCFSFDSSSTTYVSATWYSWKISTNKLRTKRVVSYVCMYIAYYVHTYIYVSRWPYLKGPYAPCCVQRLCTKFQCF